MAPMDFWQISSPFFVRKLFVEEKCAILTRLDLGVQILFLLQNMNMEFRTIFGPQLNFSQYYKLFLRKELVILAINLTKYVIQ